MIYDENPDIDYGISAEPETANTINRELNLARRIVEHTGANLFLTGKAGTGKTTFLHNLRKASGKQMVVLAPTGVAAINAKGMTLHSFFQLPFSPFIPGQGFIGEEKRYNRFSKEKRRLISCLDLIVIDEISMVRPDTLDAIDMLLKRLRSNQAPFGGLQLLLIGDLRQLAPVVTPAERALLAPHYNSEYFFESKALKEAGFLTIELQTIYRQQDEKFISLLNNVRDGNCTSKTLTELNKRFIEPSNRNDEQAICLTTHNRISDQINTLHLASLTTPLHTFYADITGKFPEYSYPADAELNLKVGSRVMFIKNDSGYERQYYNGMIGTVTEIGSKTVIVSPNEFPESEIEIGKVEWENTTYAINEQTKSVEEVVEGTFRQIPLRLAWAITIHKSQGLTFDKAVIDAGLSFAPGQLYVALSRCRSLEGLSLKSKIGQSAVIVDNTINSFIADTRKESPDDEKFQILRDEYFRKLLSELFDFQALRNAFDAFSRAVKQFVAPLYPGLLDKYRNAEDTMSSKIANVGLIFNSKYTTKRLDSDNTIENEAFQTKVQSGCRYFLEQLAPICKLLNDTPRQLDNSAYQTQLNNAMEILRFEMATKKYILKGILAEQFSIPTYLRIKVSAQLEASDFSIGKSPRSKKRTANKGAKMSKRKGISNENEMGKENLLSEDKGMEKESKRKPKGYSTYQTLQMFQEGKSIEEIAEIRGFSTGTISHHIIQLIDLKELSIEEVIPVHTLALLDSKTAPLRKPGEKLDFKDYRDAVNQLVPIPLMSIYYHFFKDN